MASEIKIPLGNRIFRRVGKPFFRTLFRILSRVELQGFEHVPLEGGYLVTGNHVSLYDPAFVLAFWPADLEAAGAADILNRPGQNILMRCYGGIPVHRGEVDRTLLQAMIDRLKSGLSVYIAPEGTRSHLPGMQQAHHGAAYVVAKAGVLVVPVGMTGTEDIFKSRREGVKATLRMVVGRPIQLPPVNTRASNRRQALLANTNMIMKAIADLLPIEYRGVYG
ncbi:MAG TPA: 1-acyl-sn-glycerol-3-phosphate acyltransferase [Anaerolineae bacterium]|nr:1-acyl-sn-glycerol-3-phosphate acyltransferase [Anaerolineae bacterium]